MTPFFCTVVLGCLSTGVVGSSRAPLLLSESHSLRLTTWTDVLSAVPNNKVKIIQGTHTRVFLTNSAGTTSEFPITQDSAFSIILKHKSTPEGIAVGQWYAHVVVGLGTEDEVYNLAWLFQPLLESVVLDSSAIHFVQSAFHDRWSFYRNPDASFLFPANIGLLMTPREIEAFEQYYGVQFAHSDYRMGLIISVNDPEEVGAEGVNAELRFDTYGFADMPGVSSYFIAGSQSDLGSANFDVVPEAWETTAPEVANYTITGTLGKGMNILLFREGGIDGLVEFVSSPPSFPPATAPAGGPTAGTTDCTPPTPQASGTETCSMTLPQDDPGCPQSGCGTVVNPADCTVTYEKAGGPFCGGGAGGSTASKTFSVTTTVTGGISIDIKVEGTGVRGSEGASSSQTESVTLTVGAGANGCGQCAQAWKKVVKCSKTCVVHKKKFIWLLLGWTCEDTRETASCVDTSGTTITTCDRTGCSG